MVLPWLRRSNITLAPPPKGYEGRFYLHDASKDWSTYIPKSTGPINYLEIGCADGGNAIIISKSYAAHPHSKLYCVDPWMDYDEYPEYKGEQETGWKTFNRNIRKLADPNKFVIKRGMSEDVVPTFSDQFFDLIFVDGNHETKYVYRDGMMSLEKVKIGGYIVFDDYSRHWLQTIAGIDKFIAEAGSRIKIVANLKYINGQMIIQRIA